MSGGLGTAIGGAFTAYKLYIFAGVALLLVGIVGTHLWGDHKQQKRYNTLLIEKNDAKRDLLTCAATNAENLVEINRQNEAIDGLARKRDEALKAGDALVQKLVKVEQKAKEDNRALRNQVKTVLVAEQCNAAPLPVDAQRVLNNAIQASSGQGCTDQDSGVRVRADSSGTSDPACAGRRIDTYGQAVDLSLDALDIVREARGKMAAIQKLGEQQ